MPAPCNRVFRDCADPDGLREHSGRPSGTIRGVGDVFWVYFELNYNQILIKLIHIGCSHLVFLARITWMPHSRYELGLPSGRSGRPCEVVQAHDTFV